MNPNTPSTIKTSCWRAASHLWIPLSLQRKRSGKICAGNTSYCGITTLTAWVKAAKIFLWSWPPGVWNACQLGSIESINLVKQWPKGNELAICMHSFPQYSPWRLRGWMKKNPIHKSNYTLFISSTGRLWHCFPDMRTTGTGINCKASNSSSSLQCATRSSRPCFSKMSSKLSTLNRKQWFLHQKSSHGVSDGKYFNWEFQTFKPRRNRNCSLLPHEGSISLKFDVLSCLSTELQPFNPKTPNKSNVSIGSLIDLEPRFNLANKHKQKKRKCLLSANNLPWLT